MRIENAYIFTETAQFVKRDITIGGQYIIDGTPDDEIIDASDLYIIPGLIDTHMHGCMGEDFSNTDMQGLKKICRYQAQKGVTSICPTTVSLGKEALERNIRLASEFDAEEDECSIIGVHLEGPFLSKDKAGAQNSEFFVNPNAGLIEALTQISDDLLYILTLAPELEGATQLIKELSESKSDIHVSVGHTRADYSESLAAFNAGANRVTHIFNAMPPLTNIDPSVIGAAFDSNAFIEIAADGVHIHPSLVRASISMFGEDRMLFVSDSMSATGMPDGIYPFGSSKFEVKNGLATLAGNDEVLGSPHSLMDCLKTAVQEMDIPLETAVRLSSMNPAISLGLFSEIGSITPGKYADMVLIDENLNIKAIIVRGHMIKNNL